MGGRESRPPIVFLLLPWRARERRAGEGTLTVLAKARVICEKTPVAWASLAQW